MTWISLGSLRSDVFEQRTSTGSEPFSLLIGLDATIFVLPSVLILIETICSKICSKSRLKNPESPLSVNVRRSKVSLLQLPIYGTQVIKRVAKTKPSYNRRTNKNWRKPREGIYPLKCKQKNRKPARLQGTAPFNLTIVTTFDSAFR